MRQHHLHHSHSRGKLHHHQIRVSLLRPLLVFLLLCAVSASLFVLPISLLHPDDGEAGRPRIALREPQLGSGGGGGFGNSSAPVVVDEAVAEEDDAGRQRSCATVEEMGEVFRDGSDKETLRVRELIRRHFDLHGAPSVRGLPSDQFCRRSFILGKASEAGFGNEMYKILTAAALSVMSNRSLIIGQTREKFPFGEYILYTNISFTLPEVKHLWRKNKCLEKHGRQLIVRLDDFTKPTETNVLCSDWRTWKQAIIWFQGGTDAVASQFFLKNIHPGMRDAASTLFGEPGSLQSRANVFGELMRLIISPTESIKEAVNWTLNGGADPDIAVHMRMMANRPVRAMQAALNCVKKALARYRQQIARPRIVLVSDTPSFIKDITPHLTQLGEVIHFDHKSFAENAHGVDMNGQDLLDFRVKDWGPAPRWVAFVDFFLASRAKYAVVSGAHRRVGTTYAQLIAALAAANQLGEDSLSTPSFSFFSSFHSNLLAGGLANQIGWGHVWNRFAGPLSCRNQAHQCAYTPLLPPAWWDGDWQSPISRDVRRLQDYGIQLTNTGKVIENSIQSYCKSKKESIKTLLIIGQCKKSKCS